MTVSISKSEYESAFGSAANAYYQDFTRKLNAELEARVHPSAKIENLRPLSAWTDVGGNIHVRLGGSVSFLEQHGEIGGEFVWLKTLKKFRGKAWSTLELDSDARILLKARHSFRCKHYDEASYFLNAIQDIDALPRSALLLKTIVDRNLK